MSCCAKINAKFLDCFLGCVCSSKVHTLGYPGGQPGYVGHGPVDVGVDPGYVPPVQHTLVGALIPGTMRGGLFVCTRVLGWCLDSHCTYRA